MPSHLFSSIHTPGMRMKPSGSPSPFVQEPLMAANIGPMNVPYSATRYRRTILVAVGIWDGMKHDQICIPEIHRHSRRVQAGPFKLLYLC